MIPMLFYPVNSNKEQANGDATPTTPNLTYTSLVEPLLDIPSLFTPIKVSAPPIAKTTIAELPTPSLAVSTPDPQAVLLHEGLVKLKELFKKYNVDIVVTSEIKGRNTGLHAKGMAIDVVPRDRKNYLALLNFLNIQEVKDLLKRYKIGAYDERTKPADSRGWTGPHIHYGIGSGHTFTKI